MNAAAPSFVPSQNNNSGNNDPTSRPVNDQDKTNRRKNNNKKPNNNYNNNGSNSGSSSNQQQKQNYKKKNSTKPSLNYDMAPDKKGRVSLNHLLSFSFPERQALPGPYRKTKSSSYQPFNKERFINANFRFMLNPSGDYECQLADPDIHFDWDTIEQVLISSGETQSCPICLSLPTAGRVTKCGHVYCLPCILHYLALRENPKRLWRKCPICYESIYQTDLKPVRLTRPFLTRPTSLDLTLMARSNTLAFPLSPTWPIPTSDRLLPWHFIPGALTFSRFMLATPDYLKGEYGRDQLELIDARSDASPDELAYLETSLDLVQVGIDRWSRPDRALAEAIQATHQILAEAERRPTKPPQDFYFYQAIDGQHLYLHPLDIKILKHEFKEYALFPTRLQVSVTGLQESTLNEEVRKKCKYLGHLPLACDVTFLEIDMKPIVSAETLAVFEQELTSRVKRRKEKERREEQKKKEAENKQKIQMARVRAEERQIIENDPFFSMYQPTMTEEESDAQLQQALAESASQSQAVDGPRTVWGTKQVLTREEELMNQVTDWADHIVITKSHRKKKGRK